MTGVVDNEDHRPRHMARPPTDAHPATQESPLVSSGEDGDGDGEEASVLPATRRPSWPASRRARAVARRRGRAVVSGPAPDTQGAAPAAPASPVAPAPPSRGRSPDALRGRRRLVLAGIAALVVGGGALAVVGVNLVRNSTAGHYVKPTASPDDPGYQAYVVPTPTMAVVQRGAGGELIGVAVLALESSEDGGTVILVPPSALTRATTPLGAATDTSGDAGEPPTMADVYRTGGAAGVVAAVADLLAVAIPDHVEVDDARWASLVRPVAPVELQLTAPVGEWEAGEVSLAAGDVGPFLRSRAPNESEVERLDRQADFWTAWLPLVSDAGVDALPGEIDVGIGRFVRSLADGSPSVVPLPGEATGGEDGVPEAFVTHDARLAELVVRAIPYPVSPSPGRRARVRLLNGTTDPDLTGAAASRLVRGGAEITIAGNAPTFDETETSMLYGRADQRDTAVWLAAGFGGAQVEPDPALAGGATGDDEIDVTVILGADARDLIGR
jgi:LytR cell envelope-related transcriptional attenuator